MLTTEFPARDYHTSTRGSATNEKRKDENPIGTTQVYVVFGLIGGGYTVPEPSARFLVSFCIRFHRLLLQQLAIWQMGKWQS